MTTISPTCSDCYFRREALCALPGERICPTFRSATPSLLPLRQPTVATSEPVFGPAHLRERLAQFPTATH